MINEQLRNRLRSIYDEQEKQLATFEQLAEDARYILERAMRDENDTFSLRQVLAASGSIASDIEDIRSSMEIIAQITEIKKTHRL